MASPDATPPAAPEPAPPPDAAGTAASNEMFERLVRGAHETIDRLADKAAPHVQRLQQGIDSAGEQIHAGSDELREVSGEWADSVRAVVRANPLTAVATALAVGILIARLTR